MTARGLPAATVRKLVHKRTGDVLVKGAHVDVGDEVRVDVAWPESHSFFIVPSAELDLVLTAETLRQVTTYVAHACLGVELGQQFLMKRLEVTRVSEVVTAAPISSARVRFEDVVERSFGIAGVTTAVEFWSSRGIRAYGRGELQVVSPRVYERMRRVAAAGQPALSSALAPTSHIARGAELKALDGGSGAQWRMLLDPRHPVFFDHELDHVPGMLVIEAALQVVEKSGFERSRVETLDIAFEGFVELDKPTTMIKRSVGDWPDKVVVAQSGIVAHISLTPTSLADASAPLVPVQARASGVRS